MLFFRTKSNNVELPTQLVQVLNSSRIQPKPHYHITPFSYHYSSTYGIHYQPEGILDIFSVNFARLRTAFRNDFAYFYRENNNENDQQDWSEMARDYTQWTRDKAFDIGDRIRNIGSRVRPTVRAFVAKLISGILNWTGFGPDGLFTQAIIEAMLEQFISGVQHKIKETISNYYPLCMVGVMIITALIYGYASPKNRSRIGVIISAVYFASSIYMGDILGTVLSTAFFATKTYEHFATEGPLMEDSKELISKMLYCAAFVSCTIQGVNLDTSEENIEKLLKKTSLAGRAFQTWDKMGEKIAETFTEAVGFVYEHFVGIPFVRPGVVAEVERWSKEVLAMCDYKTQAKVGKDPEVNARVEFLYLEYMSLRQRYVADRKLCEIMHVTAAPLIGMYKQCVQKNTVNHVMRAEPVCVFFHGGSGVGKSFLMSILQTHLLKICGKFDGRAIENNVYARAAEQEFWDGYAGQPIVIVDDFGQKRDSVANPNIEFFELIRMVNIYPYNLHMASLNDKASTAFLSKFVILTSNLAAVNTESLVSQDALIRRIHLDVQVSCKPSVLTEGKLDVVKLDQYRIRYGFDADDTSHYEFTFKGEQAKHQYDEVLTRISHLYRDQNKRFAARKEAAERNQDQKLPAGVYTDDEKWKAQAIQYENVHEEKSMGFSQWVWCSREVRMHIAQRGYVIFDDAENPDDGYPVVTVEDFEFMLREFGFRAHTDQPVFDQGHLRKLLLREFEPADPVDFQNILYTLRRGPTTGGPWAEKIRRWQYDIAEKWRAYRSRLPALNWIWILLGVVGACVVWFTVWNVKDAWKGECSTHCTLETTIARTLVCISPLPLVVRECILLLRHRRFHLYNRVGYCDKCDEDERITRKIREEYSHIEPTLEELKVEKVEFTPEQQAAFYYNDQTEGLKMINTARKEQEAESKKFYDTMPMQRLQELRTKGMLPSYVILDEESSFRQATTAKKVVTEEESSFRQATKPKNVVTERLDAFSESGRALGSDSKRRICATEGPASAQASELMSTLRKNIKQMFLEIEHDGEIVFSAMVGQFFVIKGRKAAINRHYIDAIRMRLIAESKKRTDCVVRLLIKDPQFSGTHEMKVSALFDNLTQIPRGLDHDGNIYYTEFYMFDLPMSMNPCRDMTKHMIRSRELANVKVGTRLMMTSYNTKDGTPIIREGSYKRTDDVILDVETAEGMVERRYPHSGTADISSEKGDCGSPYVVCDDTFKNKFLGLHFGGTKGSCSFSFLCREDVDPMVGDEIHKGQAMNVTLIDKPADFPLDGSFVFEGKISKPIFQPTRTVKTPSLIFEEVFENQVAPAAMAGPLKPDGPMIRGLMKNSASVRLVDETCLKSAVISYQEMLGELSINPEDTRILTFEEGCQGVVGDKAYPPLKRGKSAGFPYCQQTNQKGKMKWLGSSDWTFDTPANKQLRADVKLIVDQCSRGQVPECLFVDTLKDELRTKEKVALKKTRVFAAAPMSFSIAMRQYFGGFLAHMYRNRIYSECAVGIDAHGTDWTNVANYLRGRDSGVIAGDFSNFDGTMNYYVFHEVVNIINAWYADGKKNALIRRCLWECIEHSQHILADLVYEMSHGQPSGNITTAVTNTVYNCLVVRYSYATIFGSCVNFRRHVRMLGYGDDHVIEVVKKIAHRFNPLTLQSALSTIGMTYTDESKGEQQVELRDLTEVTFLKRGFAQMSCGRWLAPLAMESIAQMVNWITKSTSELEATRENCLDAIEELAYHPEDTYVEFSDKIMRALREKRINISIYEWSVLQLQIATDTMGKWRDVDRCNV